LNPRAKGKCEFAWLQLAFATRICTSHGDTTRSHCLPFWGTKVQVL
jgi:hypothetical protein